MSDEVVGGTADAAAVAAASSLGRLVPDSESRIVITRALSDAGIQFHTSFYSLNAEIVFRQYFTQLLDDATGRELAPVVSAAIKNRGLVSDSAFRYIDTVVDMMRIYNILPVGASHFSAHKSLVDVQIQLMRTYHFDNSASGQKTIPKSTAVLLDKMFHMMILRMVIDTAYVEAMKRAAMLWHVINLLTRAYRERVCIEPLWDVLALSAKASAHPGSADAYANLGALCTAVYSGPLCDVTYPHVLGTTRCLVRLVHVLDKAFVCRDLDRIVWAFLFAQCPVSLLLPYDIVSELFSEKNSGCAVAHNLIVRSRVVAVVTDDFGAFAQPDPLINDNVKINICLAGPFSTAHAVSTYVTLDVVRWAASRFDSYLAEAVRDPAALSETRLSVVNSLLCLFSMHTSLLLSKSHPLHRQLSVLYEPLYRVSQAITRLQNDPVVKNSGIDHNKLQACLIASVRLAIMLVTTDAEALELSCMLGTCPFILPIHGAGHDETPIVRYAVTMQTYQAWNCIRYAFVLQAGDPRVCRDGSASADACSLCLCDMLPGQRVVVLPCGHAFHARHGALADGCLGIETHVLEFSSTCPLCRREPVFDKEHALRRLGSAHKTGDELVMHMQFVLGSIERDDGDRYLIKRMLAPALAGIASRLAPPHGPLSAVEHKMLMLLHVFVSLTRSAAPAPEDTLVVDVVTAIVRNPAHVKDTYRLAMLVLSDYLNRSVYADEYRAVAKECMRSPGTMESINALKTRYLHNSDIEQAHALVRDRVSGLSEHAQL